MGNGGKGSDPSASVLVALAYLVLPAVLFAHATAAGDLLVGVKWRAVEHLPVVATLAVFPTIKFPTGSTATDAGTGTTDLGVVLISSREFCSVSLDLNAGVTHRMGDDNFAPHNSSVWAVSFGGPAYGHWDGRGAVWIFTVIRPQRE